MNLGKTYRWVLLNSTGANVTVAKVRELREKIDPAMGYTQESTEATPSLNSTATTSTGTYVTGSTVDNSTLKWEGGDFLLEVTAAAGANGSVYLYQEHSTDGGTTWPTAGQGMLRAVLPFTAGATRLKAFKL